MGLGWPKVSKKNQSVKIMSGETDWAGAHMANQCVNSEQEKMKRKNHERNERKVIENMEQRRIMLTCKLDDAIAHVKAQLKCEQIVLWLSP